MPVYSFNGGKLIGKTSGDSRLARVEELIPYQLSAGKFATQDRVNYSPLVSAGIKNAKLQVSTSAALGFSGSMSPNVIVGSFGMTATATTLSIFWDGTNGSVVILLKRADGTTQTVPPSSLTVSGLTASVTYQYFAYWAQSNLCGLGWSPGTVGTPAVAFPSGSTAAALAGALAVTKQAGNDLIANFQFAQPASGSSSGSGGAPPNPNPGMCVMTGTDIQPLGDIAPDDWKIDIAAQEEWIRLETLRGFGLCCTPRHPLYTDNGKTEAQTLKGGDWLITKLGMEKLTAATPFIRRCTRHSPTMKYGHLYWANGFLSSNFKQYQ